MTAPRDKAPSAAEELEREVREAQTAVPDGFRDDHDSEAGDTLTPSLAAQRRAKDPDHGPEDRDGDGNGRSSER